MDRQQIEAFAKKHAVPIVAIGGGSIVLIIILIKRKQSSSAQSGSKATLDTLHDDLATLDFDLNSIDTNLDNLNTFSGTPPASAITTGVPANPPGAPIPVNHPPQPPTHLGPPITPTPIRKPTRVTVPTKSGTPVTPTKGTGGPGNTYTDLVEQGWGLVGQGDYSALFDATYNIIWGYPGDNSDYAGLN